MLHRLGVCSVSCPPAIDRQDDTVDEAGGRREQESDYVRDLLSGADPAQGLQCGDLTVDLRMLGPVLVVAGGAD